MVDDVKFEVVLETSAYVSIRLHTLAYVSVLFVSAHEYELQVLKYLSYIYQYLTLRVLGPEEIIQIFSDIGRFKEAWGLQA